jgi:hypothetical protein
MYAYDQSPQTGARLSPSPKRVQVTRFTDSGFSGGGTATGGSANDNNRKSISPPNPLAMTNPRPLSEREPSAGAAAQFPHGVDSRAGAAEDYSTAAGLRVSPTRVHLNHTPVPLYPSARQQQGATNTSGSGMTTGGAPAPRDLDRPQSQSQSLPQGQAAEMKNFLFRAGNQIPTDQIPQSASNNRGAPSAGATVTYNMVGAQPRTEAVRAASANFANGRGVDVRTKAGQQVVREVDQSMRLPNVEIIERYETIIHHLEQQMQRQQQELESLRALVLTSHGQQQQQQHGRATPADVPRRRGAGQASGTSDDDGHRTGDDDADGEEGVEFSGGDHDPSCLPLNQPCRRRIDRSVRHRLEHYGSVLDEKIAQSIANRIARVTEEHVAVTVHHELRRFLEEATLNSSHPEHDALTKVRGYLNRLKEKESHGPTGATEGASRGSAGGRRHRDEAAERVHHHHHHQSKHHTSATSHRHHHSHSSTQESNDEKRRRHSKRIDPETETIQRHTISSTTKNMHRRSSDKAKGGAGPGGEVYLDDSVENPTLRDVTERLHTVAEDLTQLEGAFTHERLESEAEVEAALRQPSNRQTPPPAPTFRVVSTAYAAAPRAKSPEHARTMSKFNDDVDFLLAKLKYNREKWNRFLEDGEEPVGEGKPSQ